jgi:phosphatidate cytidylyltransferase
MKKNLKKRILTSSILFLILCISFINNYILGYILLIGAVFSVLEFFGMTKIILKKNKVSKILLNLFFVCYIFYFCTLFLNLSSSLYLKVLIYIILLTCVASDIGGFVCGKYFKGRKLTKISPNKTISGAIGSIVFSCLFISTSIFYLTKNFEIYILIIGLLVSTSSQIGDLFFSYMKRKSFLKDTGSFLPGHGGVLDRIDGILFGIPVGFLSLLIIY